MASCAGVSATWSSSQAFLGPAACAGASSVAARIRGNDGDAGLAQVGVGIPDDFAVWPAVDVVRDFHDLVHENLFGAKRGVEQDEVGACDVAVVLGGQSLTAFCTRPCPDALPDPMMARPLSRMTVLTSFMSTLISPVNVMTSAMPLAAVLIWSALAKALRMVWLPNNHATCHCG